MHEYRANEAVSNRSFFFWAPSSVAAIPESPEQSDPFESISIRHTKYFRGDIDSLNSGGFRFENCKNATIVGCSSRSLLSSYIACSFTYDLRDPPFEGFAFSGRTHRLAIGNHTRLMDCLRRSIDRMSRSRRYPQLRKYQIDHKPLIYKDNKITDVTCGNTEEDIFVKRSDFVSESEYRIACVLSECVPDGIQVYLTKSEWNSCRIELQDLRNIIK
jgi:hypothetical protein